MSKTSHITQTHALIQVSGLLAFIKNNFTDPCASLSGVFID